MPLITCKDVSFGYEGNPAVKNLNFAVNERDCLCIVGENGSGKSTLVKGLLRLKTPIGGTMTISDNLDETDIGYLPQQTAAQKDFPASVFEVILSGRLASRGFLPFYTRDDKQLAAEHLTRLGLKDLRNCCFRELSGGQQQRVLLARALCAGRKMLVLDEPVAGLDPAAARDFYAIVNRVNKETAITIIMVSHDIQSALKYSSHVLHLRKEQIFFGTTDEYLKSSAGKSLAGGHND